MKIDKKAIKLIKNGDIKTVEAVYSHYYKLVKYTVLKVVSNNEDADEITQDVFVKVFRDIEKFDTKYSFVTWVVTIAKNTAIDHTRRKQNVKAELCDDLSSFEGAYEEDFRDDLDAKIQNLLTDEEYAVFSYRIYFDFKYIEISRALNISIPAASRRYKSAIFKLKKGLDKEDFYD